VSFAVKVATKVPLDRTSILAFFLGKVEVQSEKFEVAGKTAFLDEPCQEMLLVEIKCVSIRANI
jgi:hypothetical protein